jgi:sulfhydrogenase subunit gamma (sulfur reductase)
MAVSHCPLEAEILERTEESVSIVTLTVRLTDPAAAGRFRFTPGQFNMLYLPEVGEIPVSITSDADTPDILSHAIRDVGRVSHGLARLAAGDRIGLRGPFGRGWPLDAARGHNVVVITGGLGCAPVVPVIDHIHRRRNEYAALAILHGVKHCSDLIWGDCYEDWARHPDTQVLLAADVCRTGWSGTIGPVTRLFDQLTLDRNDAFAMLCGPEPMLRACAGQLLADGMAAERIWLSLERNMQCALGQCGHCQLGDRFVCRDGPVFHYGEIRHLLDKPGL